MKKIQDFVSSLLDRDPLLFCNMLKVAHLKDLFISKLLSLSVSSPQGWDDMDLVKRLESSNRGNYDMIYQSGKRTQQGNDQAKMRLFFINYIIGAPCRRPKSIGIWLEMKKELLVALR